MAQVPIDLTRLVSQLNTSGLSQKDQPLYQVIFQLINYLRQTQIGLTAAIGAGGGGGGGGGGLTGLSGDVVAGPGVGVVPSVIQPNVVTYGKIQDVVDGQRLLGSEFPAQDVIELALGAGLGISGGVIDIQQPGGGSGLTHNLLSPTHPDTIPASPIHGDLIRATEGSEVLGEYYGFTIGAPIVEDFEGIRFGYTFGTSFVGTYFGYVPPAFAYVPVTPPDTLLAWEYIDFFILSKLVENFQGIRTGYTKTFDYLVGNNFGYYAPAFAFIVPPSPGNVFTGARWQRMGIGSDGQVLTVVGGQPEWASPGNAEVPVVCPWTAIPFVAGNFTATGGVTPSWTVDLGDVIRFEYQLFSTEGNLNNSVRIALYLRDTTVAGSAPTQLRIQLPFTLSGTFAQIIGMQENLVSVTNAFVAYSNSSVLTIQKIPFGGVGPPFDTTASGTFLSFEISAKVTDLAGCFIDVSGGGTGPVGPPGPIGLTGLMGPMGPPSLGEYFEEIIEPHYYPPFPIKGFEEGTWTPVVGGSGGTTAQTYLQRAGYYWKFGQFVWISLLVILNTKGTLTGSVEIQGLPFPAVNLTNYRASAAINWANLNRPVNVVQGFMLPGTQVLGLFYADGAGVTTVQQFVDADITNFSVFGGGFGYHTPY